MIFVRFDLALVLLFFLLQNTYTLQLPIRWSLLGGSENSEGSRRVPIAWLNRLTVVRNPNTTMAKSRSNRSPMPLGISGSCLQPVAQVSQRFQVALWYIQNVEAILVTGIIFRYI